MLRMRSRAKVKLAAEEADAPLEPTRSRRPLHRCSARRRATCPSLPRKGRQSSNIPSSLLCRELILRHKLVQGSQSTLVPVVPSCLSLVYKQRDLKDAWFLSNT
ncbi:hypothetical protein PENSPDRAFT_652398 [Peniophora sp. CONT]|nr:hypothetical protein PENSPDRAFT_652398 [Peniophora sp. CONT]